MTSPRSERRSEALVTVAFLTAALFLGLNFVAVRFSNRELAPFWGAGTRFAVAALLLFALVLARRVPFPRGRALAGAAIFGLFTFGGAYAFLYRGLVEVSAGMGAVLFATVPLLTLLAATVIGLERFRWPALAAALVVLAGIGVVFRDQVTASVPAAALLTVFGGAVSAAASGIVVKKAPPVHPFAMNAVGMAVGASVLLAASLLAGEPRAWPKLGETWMAFAYLVVSSVVAFALMVWILARWTASATSYMGVLVPVVAIVAGAALAGESVSVTALAGSFLVLVGVYGGIVAARPGARGPSPATLPEGTKRDAARHRAP